MFKKVLCWRLTTNRTYDVTMQLCSSDWVDVSQIFFIKHKKHVYHKRNRFHNSGELDIVWYQLSLFNLNSNNKLATGSFIIILKLNNSSWYQAISNSHKLLNLFLLWQKVVCAWPICCELCCYGRFSLQRVLIFLLWLGPVI